MAIALPHPEFSLSLTFQPQVWSQPWSTEGEFLKVVPESAGPLVHEIIQNLRDEWVAQGRDFPLPRGSLLLESTIPLGAGLGSSAALCVALTRWLSSTLQIPESEHFEFARRMEDRFHGHSSGMDVAVASVGKPIAFWMNSGSTALELLKLPRFTFHDTGLRSRTSECVTRVISQAGVDPDRARALDMRMAEASQLALEGLRQFSEQGNRAALEPLIRSMGLARSCFREWGLVPKEILALEESLLSQGALAVKLTGAGRGGFVVALWDSTERE
jgi:mevalonate kinase